MATFPVQDCEPVNPDAAWPPISASAKDLLQVISRLLDVASDELTLIGDTVKRCTGKCRKRVDTDFRLVDKFAAYVVDHLMLTLGGCIGALANECHRCQAASITGSQSPPAPSTDAFSQAPPAGGGEVPSFNPELFGDLKQSTPSVVHETPPDSSEPPAPVVNVRPGQTVTVPLSSAPAVINVILHINILPSPAAPTQPAPPDLSESFRGLSGGRGAGDFAISQRQLSAAPREPAQSDDVAELPDIALEDTWED